EPGTLIKTAEAPDVGYEQELRWLKLAGVQGNVLPNSWTRYDFCQGDGLQLTTFLSYLPGTLKFWLAQANYVFTQLQARSDLSDFFCLDHVYFDLSVDPSFCIRFNQPRGYLFVCPPEDFRAGGNSFRWPDCPAYWSLDPSGADRLSPEAAERFGFPKIRIETRISGTYWDSGVYEGLRRFHQGKGFDPDSQDLARHLGYPLFEL
ncbi:hypothetical protein C8R45DRAFT_877707, partial [Mycena sanguinolenta]